MSQLSFDGRVAVVTGAGRGIGRAYALLLAERGASVVVNDRGGSMAGAGADTAPAAGVVAEIERAGGTAVADDNDVGSAEGSAAVVGTALEHFGRIDVIVNNAGIMRWQAMPDLDESDLAAHLAVHLLGSFGTVRAAWPHFVEQGYGRVVMTTSAGLLGLAANTAYAAAKGGVVGLARSLAVAGGPHGILVNAIAPAAATRMGAPPSAAARAAMAPELVAPMVGYLAHESCPVTGEIYTAGAGRFARLFIAATPGWLQSGGTTIEDVAAHWDAINAETGYAVPRDLLDWSATFMSHLDLGAD